MADEQATSKQHEVDDDPANPNEAGVATTPDEQAAIALTNYGDAAVNSEIDLTAEDLSAEAVPELPVDINTALEFLNSCMHSTPRVKYGFGKKVSPHGATPGTGFTRVDCSGFVRETIWRAAAHFNFPDGSVVQHEWIRNKGFQRVDRTDALLTDDKVRIVFLRQQDSPSGVGHVALVHKAKTLESHGSHGPNSRAWTDEGWQAKAFVYVLKN